MSTSSHYSARSDSANFNMFFSRRTKRKSRRRLKFHHQALPAEYRDHYAAKLRLDARAKTAPAPPPLLADRTIRRRRGSGSNGAASRLRSSVRYGDLPYMGEMTLEKAAPRRGRKPNKADICELIFKNYGTTVLDEPLNLCLRDLQRGSATAERRSTASTAARSHETQRRQLGRQVKRKGRKSTAREKLERTFEERGFLIQTQQLESAQGATYCKFRQLRKFTRYLFRSWRHHLPGDVVSSSQA